MLELAILGLLHDEDLHGYELKKQLTELLGSWSSVSFGSLYPALRRLEKAGEVEATTPSADPAPAAPMSGSLSGEVALFKARKPRSVGGRKKKVYTITPNGRIHLRELLVDPTGTALKGDDDRVFALRVAFCRLLDPQERLDLFQRRKVELSARLDERAGAERNGSDRSTDQYLTSLRQRSTETLTSDVGWLDGLIAAEEAAMADEAELRGA